MLFEVVRCGMYALSPLERNCDQRDFEWRRPTSGGSDFDFAFYPRLLAVSEMFEGFRGLSLPVLLICLDTRPRSCYSEGL